MEFTKEKTNIAKGAAICLMFSNHLYAFHDRFIHGNYYIPLIPFFDIEQQIGNFGSICVSIFIFLSGYGMFLGYSRSQKSPLNYCLNKLKSFYFTYWTYFLIFVPIGIVFSREVTFWNSNEPRYTADFRTFLAGFLGWSTHYDDEWWFVRMFVLILLFLCPLYIKILQHSRTLLFFISISVFLAAWILRIDYTSLYGIFFWQISFAVGMLCANSNFFSNRLIRAFDNSRELWFILCLFFCMIARAKFGAKIDFLIVVIVIYSLIRIIDQSKILQRILSYLGSYSFPMWLIHSFFCYYYFQDFIYFPRWSPCIFILLTITSLLTAISIEKLRDYIGKYYVYLSSRLSQYLRQ